MDRIIKMLLDRYGEVKEMHAQPYFQSHRYPVDNGIRTAVVNLVANIPTHLLVAGHRSMVSYGGHTEHVMDVMTPGICK